MSIQVLPAKHPRWCNPTDCVIGQSGVVHLSRTAEEHSNAGDPGVAVQVLQRPGTDPVVNLSIRFLDNGPDYPAEEHAFVLDARLACATGRILLVAGREARLGSIGQAAG